MIQTPKNIKNLIIVLIPLLLILTGMIWLVVSQPVKPDISNESNGITWVGDDDNHPATASERILIPGVSRLTFERNSTQQRVPFFNPSENSAIMKMRLQLEDGTELWHSDELKPGESANIITTHNLPKIGNYHAVLVIDCQDANGVTLNGGIINLTLSIV